MKKKKIYLSGKITGLEQLEYELIFDLAEIIAIEEGFEPVNPVKLNHNHDKTWASYMKHDIKAMMDCDAILMIPNWSNSKGATTELELAYKLEMEVIYA